MPRKGNKTGRWAQQHINDPYVKKATSQGYRSRAVYKLQEIDEQDGLIISGMKIADLGAAPGGWSQYVSKKLKGQSDLIAIDLLPVEAIQGVTILQGDFQDEVILQEVDNFLDGDKFDLVISDMAPNISGVRDVDEALFEALLDSVLYFSDQRLKPGGSLLVKLFEGSAAHYYRREVKSRFKKNMVRKPLASRPKSREYYFLSQGFRPS